MKSFDVLGLNDRLNSRLADLGLTEPTPIQYQAIPHIMNGRDVMGLAQTGTGKTAAFGLPLMHGLMKIGRKPHPRTARALILAPTRELATQIHDTLRGFAEGSHIKVMLVVGGKSLNPQATRLMKGTDVLVATPGRLLDLIDRNAVSLDETGFLVLDEADQMLDLGFIHALRRIARLLPKDRQTLLFSATMPKLMAEVAEDYLNKPIRVQVSPPGKAADKIEQSVHFVGQGDKATLLRELLDGHRDERALVFGRTKHGMEKLKKLLENWGFAAASIHGNKSQGQRDRALAEFRDGEVKVLVATDVAARGLDIPEVRHVYNYELPNVAANYVHRIGRTARAGADGAAIAFCAPAEMDDLREIEKAMGQGIAVASGTPWTPAPDVAKPGRRPSKGKAPAKGAPRRRRPRPKSKRRAAA